MPDTILFFEDENSKRVPGKPTVEREAINAIVLDSVTGEVLCLDWKDFGWKTFVIGGVEEGESPVDAAKREVREETGYTELKFVKDLGRTRSAYYAAHKGENRISNATGLLFELGSTKREPTSETDTRNHEFVWIPKDRVAAFITPSSQKYIWQKTLEYL